MIDFIRGVLRGGFKLIFFAVISAFAAGFIAHNLGGSPTVFLVSWAVIALLLFAFPEIWKWLDTPV